MKYISWVLTYLLLRILIFPFYLLPYSVCLALGRFLGKIAFKLDKKHVKIARENIAAAFPEKTDTEKEEILKNHFRHLGEFMADFLFIARVDKKWAEKTIIKDPGFAELEEKINSTPRKIVISGHLGSWEVLLAYMGLYLHGGAIYKPVRNPLVDNWLKGLRSRSGCVLVPVEETFQAIKEIKKGICFGLAADQNAGKAGIFVNFLNRPASTFTGSVVLANMARARIFVLFCYRNGDKVHLTGTDLGEIDREKFADKDQLVRHYTSLWVEELEKQVKRHPEQYFWVHRRWRTKPGDFPGQR